MTDFAGGFGPLNKQLAQWKEQGWQPVTVIRRTGNVWDIMLRCEPLQ